MNDRFDELLRDFADNGEDKKSEIYKRIMSEAEKTDVIKPVKKSVSRRYAAAAVAVCLIAVFAVNAEAVVGYAAKFIRSVMPNDSIQMNEISVDYAGIISAARANTDPDSIEYQIFNKPVHTPCYVFSFYYKGYRKAIVLDKDTDNLDEIEDWLRNNIGVVGMAADSEEEAAEYLANMKKGKTEIKYAEIKDKMGDGCKLPTYLPGGEKYSRVIQYNEYFSAVSISYLYDANEEKGYNDFISLEIIGGTDFGGSLVSSMAVSESVAEVKIGGFDVYHADGYYVWSDGGFVYVLYSEFADYDQCVKIIEGMK